MGNMAAIGKSFNVAILELLNGIMAMGNGDNLIMISPQDENWHVEFRQFIGQDLSLSIEIDRCA